MSSEKLLCFWSTNGLQGLCLVRPGENVELQVGVVMVRYCVSVTQYSLLPSRNMIQILFMELLVQKIRHLPVIRWEEVHEGEPTFLRISCRVLSF